MIKGTYGFDFVLDLRDPKGRILPLTDQLSIKMRFEKPSAAVIEKTGEVYAEEADGQVSYTVEDGFLDETGEWGVQVIVTFPDKKYASELFKFTVNPMLEVTT